MTVVEFFQWLVFILSAAMCLFWLWYFVGVIFRFASLVLILWAFLFIVNWLALWPEPYKSRLQAFLSHETFSHAKRAIRVWSDDVSTPADGSKPAAEKTSSAK